MTTNSNTDTGFSSPVSAADGRGFIPPLGRVLYPTRPPLSSVLASGFFTGTDGDARPPVGMDTQPVAGAPWTAGRTADMLRHLSHHEGGHALVARALGRPVAGVTIVPSETAEGLCWSPDAGEPAANLEQDKAQMLDFVGQCVSLVLTKPRIGERRKRDEATHAYRVQQQCVELAAGKVAELVMWPSEEPFGAQHDHAVASSLAMTVVASEAVEAYLAFCAKEAETILSANRDVLAAIAAALVKHGTLTGRQLDKAIRAALAHRDLAEDRERRAAMRRRAESASASASLFERVR